MIASLSSLPPAILPAEDSDLLIAMMTPGWLAASTMRCQHGTQHSGIIRQRGVNRHEDEP